MVNWSIISFRKSIIMLRYFIGRACEFISIDLLLLFISFSTGEI